MRAGSIAFACVVLGAATTAAAAVTASPTTMKFSDPSTGVAVSKMVVLTNGGNAAVNITGASITMGAGPYTIPNPPPLPALLQPNTTLTITVQFQASTFGKTPGQLTVTTDATDSPMVTVALVGGAGAPQIMLSPLNVVFAQTRVGASSMPQVITITNAGYSKMTVSAASPSLEIDDAGPQDFALDLTGITTMLEIEDTATFKVLFRPLTVGQKYATLEVVSNGGVQDVALSGFALPALPDMAMPPLGSDMSMSSPVLDMASPLNPGNPTAPQKSGCGCHIGGAFEDDAAVGPLALLLVLGLALRLRARDPVARAGRRPSR